jgi:Family of unknown function (DUF6459)
MTLPELGTPELAAAQLTKLRLASVPEPSPPYDCELHGTACQAPPLPSYDPLDVAAMTPVRSVAGRPSGPDSSARCTVAIWPRQFAQAIIETLAGTRPVRQILQWSTERAQAHIRALGPLLHTDAGARIQRVLTSQPAPAVVEVTVIAGFGTRTRAVAMRFEHVPERKAVPGLPSRPARWICTDIETG